MAGRGFAPKPADRKVGHSKADALRVIHANPTAQPELPEFSILGEDGPILFEWPQRTRDWWKMWRDSPLSAEFTSTDWSELLDTAMIHARFWRGDVKVAGELRLRVAKFGATPEDRARLRITFAAADDAEGRRGPAAGSSARERRGPLKAV